VLALYLMDFELLLFHALLELKLVQPVSIGRRDAVAPGAHALLQIEPERVLLLLDLEPSVIDRSRPARVGGCVKQHERASCEKECLESRCHAALELDTVQEVRKLALRTVLILAHQPFLSLCSHEPLARL
jgi:hypothetical protein